MTTTDVEPIVGELFLYSQTGTEGGYWAIQDEKFTGLPAPEHYRCTRCGRVWNKDDNPDEEPKCLFTYYRDDYEKDGKNYMGGYYSSDVPIEGGQTWFKDEEPGSFNDVWTKGGNDTSLICYNEGHQGWEHMYPKGISSYEGLHIIESGDTLEILDQFDENKVVKTIKVKLIEQVDQYAEGARGARGWVIHNYPAEECMDFDEWVSLFFDNEVKARLYKRASLSVVRDDD